MSEWFENLKRENETDLRKLAADLGWTLNWDVWPETRKTMDLQPIKVLTLHPRDFGLAEWPDA